MKPFEKSVADCYSTWDKSYYEEYYGKNAPYPPVHRDLLKNILRSSGAKTLLDAGCGPASFLREIFDFGIDLYGFDLTPEMVAEGKNVFSSNNLSRERIWLGSVLDKEAYKHEESKLTGYDAVISGGVFPHIPPEEDLNFIKNVYSAVKPGGICAIEARNQLFALFTVNRYTYDLFINDLIKLDDMAAQKNVDTTKIEILRADMKQHFRMESPPVRKGKKDEPGYDEVLSRTHNPIVLKGMFENVGFSDVRILFYHFHPFPPIHKDLMPEFFLEQSLRMESNPEDPRGYFMASAFFVVGRKT